MRFFCPKYEFVGLESLKVVRKQVNSCAEKIILNDLASIRFENCKEKTEISGRFTHCAFILNFLFHFFLVDLIILDIRNSLLPSVQKP